MSSFCWRGRGFLCFLSFFYICQTAQGVCIKYCYLSTSVQFSPSVVSDSLRLHEPQHARPPCPSPTPGVYPNMSTESVMPSNHLILCHHLLLLSSIFPSIRVFSNESALHIRWPKYWSFSFNISPANEHPGLISFRMDWLDLLAVQGTLKSLLQHHSSKASILRRSAFFTVQLSHPYMTTGKTIAWSRWTFVGKVMSLIFNMLSRLVREELKQRMWGKFPHTPNLPRPRGDMLQLGYKTTWLGAFLSCANRPFQPTSQTTSFIGL